MNTSRNMLQHVFGSHVFKCVVRIGDVFDRQVKNVINGVFFVLDQVNLYVTDATAAWANI